VLEYNPEIYRAEENLRRQIDWVEKIQLRAQTLLTAHIAVLAIILSTVLAARNTVAGDGSLIRLMSSEGFGPMLLSAIFFLVLLYLSIRPFILIGGVLRARLVAATDQKGSLLYFRDIAALENEDFMALWAAMDEKSYLGDVLSQSWANARIAGEKLSALRRAQRMSWISWILLSVIGVAYALPLY
jgi:predicted small secreted protein